jgi:hypothetical protein
LPRPNYEGRGLSTHSRLGPPDERKGSHNSLRWTLAVVHVDESNRRHTRWHAPHADHSSRDNKVAIISDKAKSLFRVGNPDSLLHLCGIAVRDSRLPHRSSSPVVSLTSTLPSMASDGTICSTFWLNHPTNHRKVRHSLLQQSCSSPCPVCGSCGKSLPLVRSIGSIVI